MIDWSEVRLDSHVIWFSDATQAQRGGATHVALLAGRPLLMSFSWESLGGLQGVRCIVLRVSNVFYVCALVCECVRVCVYTLAVGPPICYPMRRLRI